MPPAAAAGAGDPGLFLQYGAIGLIAFLALLAVRVLFTQITANAERDRSRADRLEEELRKANTDLQDKTLPALASAQQVISAAVELIREERRP